MLDKLLRQFSEDTGITQKEVSQRLGYSQQRINSYWRGLSSPNRAFYEAFEKEFSLNLQELMKNHKKGVVDKVNTHNPIPVFDLELKNGKELDFFNYSDLAIFYMDAPMYADCFAAIKVSGSEMSPAFEPGDIIPIMRINNLEIIVYGRPFIVITEDQRLFRYIRKADKESNLILRSPNPENDDIIIKRADIKHLFQVNGKMTRV